MAAATHVRLPPLPTIRDMVRLYKLRAIKQLSQNFLMDERLTDKIVRMAGKIVNAHVCEVGPGPGGITRSILRKNPKNLILIEKDPRFLPTLELLQEACASHTKVHIEIGDVLQYNFEERLKDVRGYNWHDPPPPIHLIGNLPFSVSTILIIKWLKSISERNSAWKFGRTRMTLTFQKEVAERIVADASNEQRCRLSVITQMWCQPELKFIIPGKAFVPKPDVDVGVVTLEPLKNPLVQLPFNLVEKVLRSIFNMRQKYSLRGAERLFPKDKREDFGKTDRSSLIILLLINLLFPFSILGKRLFYVADVDYTTRPFQITNDEFVRIFHAYKLFCDEYPELINYDSRMPNN